MSWQGKLYHSITNGEPVEVVKSLLAEGEGQDKISVEVTELCSCINKLDIGFPLQPSVHALSLISNIVKSGTCPHAEQVKQESAEPQSASLKVYVLSALYISATHGHSHLVDFLLRKGYDKNFTTPPRQRTPLHVAAMSYNEEGGTECVRLLIENGADVNAKDYHGYTPVMVATKAVRNERVELLIKGNCDVNLKNSSQETAVYMGTLVGAVDCVKTLLNANADANIRSVDDISPLLMAVRRGSVEMVQALLNCPSGCDVNIYQSARDKMTPLFLATHHGNVDIVKLLLEAGADPNSNPSEITPLSTAAHSKYVEISRLLLIHGASVNLVNDQGYAAIHLAAWEGCLEIVEMLLNAGSLTDEGTGDKNTPLSLACHGNHFNVAVKFVQLGCNVNNSDKDKDTPLLYTTFNGCFKSSKLLMSHGANPDYENNVHCTPLWNAVYSNSPEIVELLLQANVRLSVSSIGIDQHANTIHSTSIFQDKKSPLHVACLKGFFTVAKILVLAGTDLQQEKWLRQEDALPIKVTNDQKFWVWIMHKVVNPVPLKGQCRTVIRNLAKGKALVDTAPLFELPTTLLNYLLLNELM